MRGTDWGFNIIRGNISLSKGCVKNQAVICPPLTAETTFETRSVAWHLWWREWHCERFSACTSVFCGQYHSTTALLISMLVLTLSPKEGGALELRQKWPFGYRELWDRKVFNGVDYSGVSCWIYSSWPKRNKFFVLHKTVFVIFLRSGHFESFTNSEDAFIQNCFNLW